MNQAPTEIKPPRFRRKDTYAEAARIIGCTRGNAHRVLNGNRPTTTANLETLRKWALQHKSQDGENAPAVQAALDNLFPAES